MGNTVFLGFALPWGQMSSGGAAVAASLLSLIPYLGVVFGRRLALRGESLHQQRPFETRWPSVDSAALSHLTIAWCARDCVTLRHAYLEPVQRGRA